MTAEKIPDSTGAGAGSGPSTSGPGSGASTTPSPRGEGHADYVAVTKASDLAEIEGYQCARCGSSLDFEDCGLCEATGHTTDRPDPECPSCGGTGREPVCFSASSSGWCEAHPLPGRGNVYPHTPEPYGPQRIGRGTASGESARKGER